MTPSPCVRNCCLDENDICLGCHRSISEICTWSQLDEQGRKKVLRHAEVRKEVRAETGRSVPDADSSSDN
ncbi:MAG: DUF1289 domain-containing protein [Agarilytica sp.]